MIPERRVGWERTALHWEREELIVEHRVGIAPERARAIVRDLLASGRVPPLRPSPSRAGGSGILGLSRLWLGAHQGPDGPFWVAVIDSHCLIGRPVRR